MLAGFRKLYSKNEIKLSINMLTFCCVLISTVKIFKDSRLTVATFTTVEFRVLFFFLSYYYN